MTQAPALEILEVSPQELTLNRAHKVVERLKELLATKRAEVRKGLPSYVHVTIDAAGERSLKAHRTAAEVAFTGIREARELNHLLAQARIAIGRANDDHGVNRLLAEAALTKTNLDWHVSLLSTLEASGAVSHSEFVTLAAEHAAARQARLSADAGANVPVSQVSVATATADEVAELKRYVEVLQGRRVMYSDQVASLNLHKVTLQLPKKYLTQLLGVAEGTTV